MATTTPASVTIGGAVVALAYNGRAIYRLQSLGLPVELRALHQPGRGHFALCNWLWACAVPAPWAKPEDLAAEIKDAEIEGALTGLFAAIDLAVPSENEAEAKKNSAPSAPLPASSSG